MNNQLEELRKWSEEFTRSAWEGVSQMMKGFQASQKPAGQKPAGDILNNLVQLNQLTLSVLEQYRYWEKMNESLKQFSEGLLGGVKQKPDARIQELESELTDLKAKLTAQESILQELQAKLQSEEKKPAGGETTTKILSDFLSEQTKQFEKLVKKGK